MGRDRKRQRSGASRTPGTKKKLGQDGSGTKSASTGRLGAGSLPSKSSSSPSNTRRSSVTPKARQVQDPTPSILNMTNKKGKLSKDAELRLLKRAYVINKNPSGPEIRHISHIMKRSPGPIRAWFDAHKPVETRDAVDRELQTALEGFDYLDSSPSEDDEDDDLSDSSGSDEELVTPKNHPVVLPKVANVISPSVSTVSKHKPKKVDVHPSSDPPTTRAQSRQASSPTPRPPRTASGRSLIDGDKKATLEAHFAKDPNPSMEARKKLAHQIHIDAHRISQWFAMRRFRLRRASDDSTKSNDALEPEIISSAKLESIPETSVPRKIVTISARAPPATIPPAKATANLPKKSIVMSLRSKNRKEPSSSSSSMELPPPKRIRFAAPAPVKSKSTRPRHAPRTFFPIVDWNAPPSPSDRTPRFTYWFAKEQVATAAVAAPVDRAVMTANVDMPVAVSELPKQPAKTSFTSMAVPSNPSKQARPDSIPGTSSQASTSLKPPLSRAVDTVHTPRSSSYPAQIEAHISRAQTILRKNPSVDAFLNVQAARSHSSQSRSQGTFSHPLAQNTTQAISKSTQVAYPHSTQRAPGSFMHTSSTIVLDGDASRSYNPSVHPQYPINHRHGSVSGAFGTSSSSLAPGYWAYPSTITPSNPISSHRPSGPPGLDSLAAVHNNLVNSAVSKLDVIAAIARLQTNL